jgi:integrase
VTADLLRAHRRRSREEALARGTGWREGDYVFTSVAGTPIAPSNLTGLWHAFCADIGLGRIRLHALRHTAATLLLTHGVPPAVISKTLGHAGLAITADIYADVVPELQRDAADAMQRALGS